ncbi:eukaryotic porin-domain-containing protein [Mycena filopes]|nr:eukaryotic porin-domain-containing protein [Mycena filopes]
MIQLEHDYQGQDFSINAKTMNPSPTDGTGIYVGSYLQSITKNIALGIESIYQRQTPDVSDFSSAYLAKITGTDKNWIATAQTQGLGVLQATYWHKLSEKVEAAADLQLIALPQRREAIATIGAKYDLRLATFRAQFDSTGKVSALLEQRFTPTFAFLISGEIDHFKVCFLPPFQYLLFNRCLVERRQGWRRRHDRELYINPRGDGHASSAIINTI